jgi:hypothetical protein
MRLLRLLLILPAIGLGCKDAAGPAGLDPTVRITNQTNWPIYFEWRDGQGVVGTDTIAGMGRACERFFARADSAYFYMEVTDLSNPGTPATSTYTQPWFDPTARHAWTAVISPSGGSPAILVTQDSTVAAC